MMDFLSFLLTPCITLLFRCDNRTKITTKEHKNLLMNLTCSGHSLLQEAARRTLFHVYSSVDMRLATSASEVVGRIESYFFRK